MNYTLTNTFAIKPLPLLKLTVNSIVLLLATTVAKCQEDWPHPINGAGGVTIRIYHPQPDSFVGNILHFHAAFYITKNKTSQPQFGSFRARATFESDRNNRSLRLQTVNILTLRLAGNATADSPTDTSASHLSTLRNAIESGLPAIASDISIDRLITLIQNTPPPQDPSIGLRHDPPHIIIANKPSILLFIDGAPRLKWNHDYAMQVVANSPFAVFAFTDNWFYCYGGRHWYISPSLDGPWIETIDIPFALLRVEILIDNINDRESGYRDTTHKRRPIGASLHLSSTPAELLHTNGAPLFSPIPGTRLQYAANTDNAIFLDTLAHQYRLLISGRWFGAAMLSGPWKYIPPDSLLPDFARIPEASPAAGVLPFIPGTTAARDAIIDAAIPQTTTVNRRTATTTVSYDGIPEFLPIAGTRLAYARNTSSMVIRGRYHFYCVDKGVWFTSQSTAGPWIAATDRPEQIENIPPDCPIYPCKYAYIYGYDNNSVFTGYTAGYLQSYTDGKTLVYGTGYYNPAYKQNNVYPRPRTYGCNITYNPWFGWCLGADYSPDWFNTATSWGIGDWNSGWFGPPGYRPPYLPPIDPANSNNQDTPSIDNVPQLPPGLAVSDSSGNIFLTDDHGGWLLLKDNAWLPATIPYLDNLRNQLLRGEMRVRDFRRACNR